MKAKPLIEVRVLSQTIAKVFQLIMEVIAAVTTHNPLARVLGLPDLPLDSASTVLDGPWRFARRNIRPQLIKLTSEVLGGWMVR